MVTHYFLLKICILLGKCVFVHWTSDTLDAFDSMHDNRWESEKVEEKEKEDKTKKEEKEKAEKEKEEEKPKPPAAQRVL